MADFRTLFKQWLQMVNITLRGAVKACSFGYDVEIWRHSGLLEILPVLLKVCLALVLSMLD